jgi:hypothetical protein
MWIVYTDVKAIFSSFNQDIGKMISVNLSFLLPFVASKLQRQIFSELVMYYASKYFYLCILLYPFVLQEFSVIFLIMLVLLYLRPFLLVVRSF